jgi:hypothetical protein
MPAQAGIQIYFGCELQHSVDSDFHRNDTHQFNHTFAAGQISRARLSSVFTAATASFPVSIHRLFHREGQQRRSGQSKNGRHAERCGIR